MIMDTKTILFFIVLAILIIFIINQNNQNNQQIKNIENFQDNEIVSVINPSTFPHDYKGLNNEVIYNIINYVKTNNINTINNLFSFKKSLTNGSKYLGHNLSIPHPEYDKYVNFYHLYKPIDKYNVKPINFEKIINFKKYNDKSKININGNHIDLNFLDENKINKIIENSDTLFQEIKKKNIQKDDKGYYYDFKSLEDSLNNMYIKQLYSIIDRDITIKASNSKYYKITKNTLIRYFYRIVVYKMNNKKINSNLTLFTSFFERNNLKSRKLYYASQGINFTKNMQKIFENLKTEIDKLYNIIKRTSYFTRGFREKFPQHNNHHIKDIFKPAGLGLDMFDSTLSRVNQSTNKFYDFYYIILPNARANRSKSREKMHKEKQFDWRFYHLRLDNRDYDYDKLGDLQPDNGDRNHEYRNKLMGHNFNHLTKIQWDQRHLRHKYLVYQLSLRNVKFNMKDLDIYIHNPSKITNDMFKKINRYTTNENENENENIYKKINNFLKNSNLIDNLVLKQNSNIMKQFEKIKANDDKIFISNMLSPYSIYRPIAPDSFVCLGDVIVKEGKNESKNQDQLNGVKESIMCIPKSCYIEIRSWDKNDRVASIFHINKENPSQSNIINFYVNPFTNTFRTTTESLDFNNISEERKLPPGKVGRIAKCPDVKKFDDIVNLVNRHKKIVSRCKAEKAVNDELPVKSNDFDTMEQSYYLNNIYKQDQRIKFLKKKANKMLITEKNAEVSKREKNRQDLQSYIEKQRETIERGLMKLKETQNQVEINISYPMRVVKNVIQMVADSNQPVEKKIEIIKQLKEITDTPDYKDKIDKALQSCPDLDLTNHWERDAIPCYGCDYST